MAAHRALLEEVVVPVTIEDEGLLLDVLNSAPVLDGRRAEHLAGAEGSRLARRHGGSGRPAELGHLREVRDVLHEVVRGDTGALASLAPVMERCAMRPELGGEGVRWTLSAPEDLRLAARAVLAWSGVQEGMPGRLRPCANSECNLFLLDRSRPGTARWCSMAACGNRAKARTHARRRRASTPTSSALAQEVGE